MIGLGKKDWKSSTETGTNQNAAPQYNLQNTE
jgi:hypothetical protein